MSPSPGPHSAGDGSRRTRRQRGANPHRIMYPSAAPGRPRCCLFTIAETKKEMGMPPWQSMSLSLGPYSYVGGPAQYSPFFKLNLRPQNPGIRCTLAIKNWVKKNFSKISSRRSSNSTQKKRFFLPGGPFLGPKIVFSYLGFPTPVLGHPRLIGPGYGLF